MKKNRTGPQTNLQLCRLPVSPEGRQGQTHPRALADLKCKIGLLTATEKPAHLSRLHEANTMAL